MPLLPTKNLPLLANMDLEHPLCPLCYHSCFRNGNIHSGNEESKITSTEFFMFTLSTQKAGLMEKKD